MVSKCPPYARIITGVRLSREVPLAMAEAQRALGPLKVAVAVTRRSEYMLARRKMPRMMALDVV
jgi:hypothetical protein